MIITAAEARRRAALIREARLLIVWTDSILHQVHDAELSETEAASRIVDLAWSYKIGKAMAQAQS